MHAMIMTYNAIFTMSHDQRRLSNTAILLTLQQYIKI